MEEQIMFGLWLTRTRTMGSLLCCGSDFKFYFIVGQKYYSIASISKLVKQSLKKTDKVDLCCAYFA